MRRQSRRAQNDILSTIGVCQRISKDGTPIIDRKKGNYAASESISDSITRENEVGSLIFSMDWILFSVSSLCFKGLRQRLQVRIGMCLA